MADRRSRTATPRTREILLPPWRDPLYRAGVMHMVMEYLTDEEADKLPRELVRSEVWG